MTNAEQRALSVSLVTFAPALQLLQATLHSLAQAAVQAHTAGLIVHTRLTLIDNGPPGLAPALTAALARVRHPALRCDYRGGHGNLGYARGNNLVILAETADYHLILNPDVVLAPEALSVGLRYLAHHPEVVLLAPAVLATDGRRGHLCKAYPTVFDLALRGLVPAAGQRRFARRLARYTLAELDGIAEPRDVPLVSGSFMLCRGAALRQVGGFDPGFFLYFEDFDLSLRLAALGRVQWLPTMCIEHAGGGAARKGWRHRGWFIRSAARFFHRHGWRWW